MLIGAATALTVAACAVGALGRPRPDPGHGSGTAGVPASLLALLLVASAVCLLAGAVLTRPASLGTRTAVATWWLLVVLSLAGSAQQTVWLTSLDLWEEAIPVFGWIYTALPAALVGLATARAGRSTHRRATLGTAVVTVPPVGLAWAVAAGADGFGSGLATGLWTAALLGAVPLAIAVVLTGRRVPRGAPVG